MSQVRNALLIATSEYQDPTLPPLRSPAADATALANVLRNPAIGAFDLELVINQTRSDQLRHLMRFFGNRGRTDLLLVYISCHGLMDEGGQLYFAATDTVMQYSADTAISAASINRLISQSRSRNVVLVLDCCYSGSLVQGMNIKASDEVDLGESFEGGGRVIIASTTSLGYSLEQTDESGKTLSIFTSILVRGLETGAADLNLDGFITVDELYAYIREEMFRLAPPNQTPSILQYNVQGEILIARNPAVSMSPIDTAAESIDQSSLSSQASGQAGVAFGKQREPAAAEGNLHYTAEPIITNDYWTIADQLDYEPYATAIAEFIRHDGTIPPLTIGIKAPWGAGKTSLMRMVQDRLDPPAPNTKTLERNSRRQDVTLSTASRRLLVGRPAYSRLLPRFHRSRRASIRITNGILLRKLRPRQNALLTDAVGSVPSSEDKQLTIESPSPNWRPTVWFSPWMHQSGEQIWAGLAYEVITQVTERMQPVECEGFWLELNLRRIDADALRRRVYKAMIERLVPLFGALVATILLAVAFFLVHLLVHDASTIMDAAAKGLLATGTAGVAIAAVLRAVLFWRQPLAGSLTSLVHQPDYISRWQEVVSEPAYSEVMRDPQYERRLGYLYLVQTDMKRVLDLVATKDRPIVIFVDDLDRCSPAAVTQVIEAINLFIAGQFPNCIFVVAMDPEMVAAHIEVAYRSLVYTLSKDDYWGDARVLGWRFLDKIVQLPVSLPTLRSDQASQFLETALTNMPNSRAGTGLRTELDAIRLRKIEDAIRSEQVSIGNISDVARAADEELSGATDTTGPLSAEAQEAVRRELQFRLRPDNPEIQAIVASVSGRLARNPREIKRFVNVFRFYAVLRQEREAAGFPVPDGVAEIAKLAVIAVRWPDLRSALGHQIGATERDTLLALLEDQTAQLSDPKDRAARKKAFEAALAQANVPARLREKMLASEDLCELLACSPLIGTAAAGYL